MVGNTLEIVGEYKGRPVWASPRTIKRGHGPLYVQATKGLRQLSEKEKDSVIEHISR
tara:strand:+ start:312 stop:482 length:171 start_codon:yes stop_codon:yes gene_type:complete